MGLYKIGISFGWESNTTTHCLSSHSLFLYTPGRLWISNEWVTVSAHKSSGGGLLYNILKIATMEYTLSHKINMIIKYDPAATTYKCLQVTLFV